jgi:CspA family cold shock protein
MSSGIVKWFNQTKGYGFLEPSDGGGPDVFVHMVAVERAGLDGLQAGQRVEFETELGRNGKMQVKTLRIVGPQPPEAAQPPLDIGAGSKWRERSAPRYGEEF